MIIALLSGFVLGVIFFGGLWLTVRNTIGKTYAGLWIAGSSFIRMAITLAGFYFASQGDLQRLLICVATFIATRFLVVWLTFKYDEKHMISTPKQA